MMVVVKRKETGDNVPNTAQLELGLNFFQVKNGRKYTNNFLIRGIELFLYFSDFCKLLYSFYVTLSNLSY